MTRFMKHFLIPLLASAIVLLSACPDRNYCLDAPACENNRAINCVDSCQQGPCSTGAHLRDCAGAEKCEVVPGRPQSLRFNPARAVCTLDSDSCDPLTAAPPQCDGQGAVSGCSSYNRRVVVACAQAAVYFENPSCCVTGINPDAGSRDADTDGGSDAGP